MGINSPAEECFETSLSGDVRPLTARVDTSVMQGTGYCVIAVVIDDGREAVEVVRANASGEGEALAAIQACSLFAGGGDRGSAVPGSRILTDSKAVVGAVHGEWKYAGALFVRYITELRAMLKRHDYELGWRHRSTLKAPHNLCSRARKLWLAGQASTATFERQPYLQKLDLSYSILADGTYHIGVGSGVSRRYTLCGKRYRSPMSLSLPFDEDHRQTCRRCKKYAGGGSRAMHEDVVQDRAPHVGAAGGDISTL